MNKPLLFHPFLFGVYPLLFLYSNNIELTTLSQLFIPVIFILFLVLFVILISNYLFKNIIKVGIVLTAFLILFFSYGHFFEILKIIDRSWESDFKIGRARYLLPAWCIIFSLIVYRVKEAKNNMFHFNKMLNVVSAVLVSLSIINILIYILSEKEITQNSKELKYSNSKLNLNDSLRNVDRPPDIYYIVPDMYTSANVLKEFYNFEDDEFNKFLKQNNFYIVEKSHANYSWTNMSLSSSLNMDYLQNLIDLSEKNINIGMETTRLIKDNKLMQILKSFGYEIVNIESGIHSTNTFENADLIIQPAMRDELINELINSSLLLHFDSLFGGIKRNRVLNTFEEIINISKNENPKFVMAHLNVPHGPYVFGKNGERVWFSKMLYENRYLKRGEKEREEYLNQLIFVSKKLREVIDKILQKSSTKPIIVIQGDHGPATFFPEGPWPKNPTEKMLKERLGIINAIFLPDNKKLFYDTISPVNTFRLILNEYFGANYKLLKDNNYYAPFWKSSEIIDVTNVLNKEVN
tara:strand:+ start:6386 stop:7948 length:1563 start_codon:yes stop_codon:yes gene_type:complete